MTGEKERRAYGTGVVYYDKRRNRWIAQVSHDGRRVTKSARTEAGAERLKLQMLKTDDLDGLVRRTRLDDLVKLLKSHYRVNGCRSLSRAMSSVGHIRRHLRNPTVQRIDHAAISGFIAKRLDEGAAEGTAYYDTAILHHMLALGVRARLLKAMPPFPRMSAPANARKGFFEEGEWVAVRAHLPTDVAPMFEFMYVTGWRKEEVRGLRWTAVDFVAGTVRLEGRETKNKEARVFPISALAELEALVRRQRERADNVQREHGCIVAHVFFGENGRPISEWRYERTWKAACEAAKLPGRLPHDFRRTAVRRLERAGVPRSVAMKLTGHKTEAVYRRYAITNEADLVEGVAKVAAQLQADRQAAGVCGDEKARRKPASGRETTGTQAISNR